MKSLVFCLVPIILMAPHLRERYAQGLALLSMLIGLALLIFKK